MFDEKDEEGVKQVEQNVVDRSCNEKIQLQKPMLRMVSKDKKKLPTIANYAREVRFGVMNSSSNMARMVSWNILSWHDHV